MGSSCSSGQAHKDKDSVSTRSEESPSYQIASVKRPSIETKAQQPLAATSSGHWNHSGVILEASTAGHVRTTNGTTGSLFHDVQSVASPSAIKVVTAHAALDSVSLSSPAPTSATPGNTASSLSAGPAELECLPEQARAAILGRVQETQVHPRTRKIVLYICAADSQDCCCEKGALQQQLYPILRSECLAKGFELHIADLHWRTALEKQQDHEFPQLCLGELARHMESSYVIPVIFLSNSLGTPLLPKSIESQDFELALGQATGDKQLLSKWYKLDSAAQPPCYTLQAISSHIPGFKENSAEERERALSEWRSEIERTLAVMVNVFPQELRDTYLTTVVEQEVHNTVCMSQELARRCLWLSRIYTQAPPPPHGPVWSEHRRRLDALHKDLRNLLYEKNILRVAVPWVEGGLSKEVPEHANYLEEVSDHLAEQLRAIIQAIIEEDHNKSVVKSSYGVDARLIQELLQQITYCQRAAQSGGSREQLLQAIQKYVESDGRGPLVLYGPTGSGKTTLMARAAQCCHHWSPDSALVLRFVGLSPDSATTERLLKSIVDQCSILAHGHPCWSPHTIESYTEVLPGLLAAASQRRPIIFVIDGIDQVKTYGSLSLDWLPLLLPDRVKVILSVAEDTPMHKALIAKVNDSTAFIQLTSLTGKEAQSVLVSSVMQYKHSVDKGVQEGVTATLRECTLPLYLKVLAWQTACWSEDEQSLSPLGALPGQLDQLLAELENSLGVTRVQHALALLTASKHGLRDAEMLDLLARDPAFHSESTYVVWAPACLFWPRLIKQLGPFLNWSSVGEPSSLSWRDGAVREALQRRYLATEEQRKWAHGVLARYYEGKLDSGIDAEALSGRVAHSDEHRRYDKRKLVELPYQVLQLEGTIKERFLLNFEWLYSKLCGTDVLQVLEDIAMEPGSSSDPDLVALRSFLEFSAPALLYDGRQMYAQAYAYWKSASANMSPWAQRLLAASENPPVITLVPTHTATNSTKQDFPGFDSIQRLDDSEDLAVTVSTEREEISVWSVPDGRRLRTLKGIPQPITLKDIDQIRCVVLCGRELRIYDLENGQFVTRLKGVMNQKMPYFGLHDAEHLVTLSRNRMYVNLMNLQTGDCVTTFKAGEDRFLNSLLVSGDGRVLVCGDETQKPFPLLVWNLASRKLLYDLRIPHHDFVTSLAAITYEGHYVCCVAKEVDEPGPNFIVVYDLQSGTLFKKWKPSVNTVSLDISSRDLCVISGLEDSRILVWDLTTGNCRWTLFGHTAPVSLVRLDPCGGSFLSADRQGRDRSLRLWSLSRGNLLAVYTPERPVRSCEILPGGRSVVLVLDHQDGITTLHLRGPGLSPPPEEPVSYGADANDGRVFDLREEAR